MHRDYKKICIVIIFFGLALAVPHRGHSSVNSPMGKSHRVIYKLNRKPETRTHVSQHNVIFMTRVVASRTKTSQENPRKTVDAFIGKYRYVGDSRPQLRETRSKIIFSFEKKVPLSKLERDINSRRLVNFWGEAAQRPPGLSASQKKALYQRLDEMEAPLEVTDVADVKRGHREERPIDPND